MSVPATTWTKAVSERCPPLDPVRAEEKPARDVFRPTTETEAPTIHYPQDTSPEVVVEQETTAPHPVLADYELLEVLGRGGMGVVYKARHRRLQRIVAVKTLLEGSQATAARERFEAEAQNLARLMHPGIVALHEMGMAEGQLFLAMQYVGGDTLAKTLTRGPVAPRRAARMVADLARAIEYAHGQGVLHLDLKPSNVIVDAQGDVHITDFGLARNLYEVKQATRPSVILGTPGYMSPEQAEGHTGALGPASDVFSLGVLFYELLTGKPAFRGHNLLQTLRMVVSQDPVPPRQVNPRVDRELQAICLRCLNKDPHCRYGSAGALADDLEAFLLGEPTSEKTGLSGVLQRLFRDAPQAQVLQPWGTLWVLHGLQILALCLATRALWQQGSLEQGAILGLWAPAMALWALCLWLLRRRRGPVSRVERQVAHVWAAGALGTFAVLVCEWFNGLPPLQLCPWLAGVGSMVFFVKAGLFSGLFYLAALALAACAGLLLLLPPDTGLLVFGVVAAACFMIPGLRFARCDLAAD